MLRCSSAVVCVLVNPRPCIADPGIADDGLLLVWNILHGSLEQTISVTFNGPVSAAVWTPISPNRPSTTFAFGCADGTMFAYHQTREDVSFSLFFSLSY